jgi:hypothetical protein
LKHLTSGAGVELPKSTSWTVDEDFAPGRLFEILGVSVMISRKKITKREIGRGLIV